MILYTKKRLFACWNNLHTIVSACGDYSPFQIVYALRRQSPLSNSVRTRTQFRLFLMESLCQRSLVRRSRDFRLLAYPQPLPKRRGVIETDYMLSPEGRVVAIVVLVALAGLVARVVLGAAEPRGLNDNSSQFYSSIIVNFFPFFVDWKNVPCTLTIHK